MYQPKENEIEISREIKFKVWDKENKVMISAEDFAFEEYLPLSQLFQSDEFVFLLYTGLKDKNNQEIYEGDIIKYPNSLCKISIVTIPEIFKMNSAIIDNCEIIGNKYENPELLKEI